MGSLTLPAWARAAHPIVRYERRHWQASRTWRLVNVLLWGGSLVFLLVPAACSLLFTVGFTFQSPAEVVLGLGGLFTLGLFIVTAILSGLNALCAGILGATVIARERESQTWPFLRLTPLTGREIALGKLMAVFYTLGRPLAIITGLRLLALLGGLVTVIVAYLVSGANPYALAELAAALQRDLAAAPGHVFPGLMLLGLGLLVGLVTWLAEPLWGVLYNGVLGLAASTLVRSRGAAVAVLFGAQFGIALGLVAPAQQIALLATAPFIVTSSGAPNSFLALFIVGSQAALGLVLSWGVLAGALYLALRRADTLGD
ncbi:MAG: hypothetical protein IT317_13235 [Anaerolineales bacterium]|nr:hypothetical protein [Anaerolineales bacterium]